MLTTLLVLSGLYFLVFERAAVKAVSNGAPLSALFISVTDIGGSTIEEAEPKIEIKNFHANSAIRGIGVVALKSVEQQIDSAVILRGQTEAAREVHVRAETSGQVISEPLRKGTFVKKYQVLCRLDPGTKKSILANANAKLAEAKARIPETQARLDEAESRLDEAKINFNGAKRLAQDGYATETRVAATQAAVRSTEADVASARVGFKATRARIESAEAAVAGANKEIERLVLRAPFSGLLEIDTTEIGSLLQHGSLCATIIQLNPIKLVGFVAEVDMPRVKVGANAKAELLAGHTVYGKVTFLSRSADKSTRTFRVDVEVQNHDFSISDGQTADIMISAESKMAHLVPQSALTLNDEGYLGVRIITTNRTAQFVKVKMLIDTAKGVWLTGLPERADIIVVGQEYVKDDVIVDPSFREPTQ